MKNQRNKKITLLIDRILKRGVFLIASIAILIMHSYCDSQESSEIIDVDQQLNEIHESIINSMCEFLPETLEVKKGIFKKPEKKIYTKMVMCSTSVFDGSSLSYFQIDIGFSHSELKRFIEANRLPSRVFIPKMSSEKLYVLGETEYGGLKWGNLNEKLPLATGFCGYSQIGFSDDKTKALIYYFRQYGPLAGGGFFAVFKNENGKWIRVKTIQTWKS